MGTRLRSRHAQMKAYPDCNVIVSKLVQTAMAMVSLTKIRTMNVNARRAVALVLYLMTTILKK